MTRLIDLTHTIEDFQPVYPGDEETRLYQTKQLDADGYNNHRLEISMHSGTHLDTPMHLTKSNKYVCDLPLESFIGNGCVLDVRNEPIIKMKKEYEKKVIENSILLLCTGQDKKFGTKEYFSEIPVIDMEFARYLANRKIKILGMDSPSPDKYPFDIHKLLFEHNILIIENLTNVEKLLKEESFEVIAFPLKIKADGSLLRVAARII
ncbi:MAG: cyclase family protein [Bacillota bacterium]